MVSFEKAVVINVKTFEQSTGANAEALSVLCDRVAEETKGNVIVVVQNADVYRVVKALDGRRKNHIPVFAQHVDYVTMGKGTGKDTPEALIANGAAGVLINHSEDKLTKAEGGKILGLEEIQKRVDRCNGTGLATLVCSGYDDESLFVAEAREIAKMNIGAIAPEPPALIGGEKSVTTEEAAVRRLVSEVKEVNPKLKVLFGAGVKKGEHVRDSINFGGDGALLASGVVIPLRGVGDLQGEAKAGVIRRLTDESLNASEKVLKDLVAGTVTPVDKLNPPGGGSKILV